MVSKQIFKDLGGTDKQKQEGGQFSQEAMQYAIIPAHSKSEELTENLSDPGKKTSDLEL